MRSGAGRRSRSGSRCWRPLDTRPSSALNSGPRWLTICREPASRTDAGSVVGPGMRRLVVSDTSGLLSEATGSSGARTNGLRDRARRWYPGWPVGTVTVTCPRCRPHTLVRCPLVAHLPAIRARSRCRCRRRSRRTRRSRRGCGPLPWRRSSARTRSSASAGRSAGCSSAAPWHRWSCGARRAWARPPWRGCWRTRSTRRSRRCRRS